MPLFEFFCPRDAFRVEKLQAYSDPPPACEECGGMTERSISRSTGFSLKGEGWARDGYGTCTGRMSGLAPSGGVSSALPAAHASPPPLSSSSSSSRKD
jgi:putative FmdB family regulatory protein